MRLAARSHLGSRRTLPPGHYRELATPLHAAYFPPFEAAVDHFHRAGGHKVLGVHSPPELLDEFKAGIPDMPARALGNADTPVELADSQDSVSVQCQHHGPRIRMAGARANDIEGRNQEA